MLYIGGSGRQNVDIKGDVRHTFFTSDLAETLHIVKARVAYYNIKNSNTLSGLVLILSDLEVLRVITKNLVRFLVAKGSSESRGVKFYFFISKL